MSRVTGCVLIIMLVSGCGTFNPHVRGDASRLEPNNTDMKKPPLTLLSAIAYADSAKKRYHHKLGNQASMNSWLGVGLIPLGAAATGLGITGGPAVAITALALTGASGYGIGAWLTSKPSQRAWVAGFNATSCAVDVMLPLLPMERDLVHFLTNTDAIAASINEVTVAISALDIQRMDKTPVELKEANAARAEALAMIVSARSAQTSARELNVDAYTAGERLKEAVDRISGQVSSALVENGPDLQALSSIIGGLGQSYKQFIPSPVSPPKATPQKIKTLPISGDSKACPGHELASATSCLNIATENLAESVGKVAAPVNMVMGRKPVETLKACGVSPDKIAMPMTIDPPGAISIDGCIATTSGRVIKGGTSPYAVTLPTGTTDITVRQTASFGPAFFIETKGNINPVKTTIHATDGSGNNAFVDITVEKCGTDKKSPKPEKPPGRSPKP